jgi:hypothetical protein
MTAAELMSREQRDGWDEAFQSLVAGEADVVSKLARQMRAMAGSERACGIDAIHTLERVIRLAEDYAEELRNPSTPEA